MVEKGSKGGICHAIHQYVKASNKYMNNYNNKRELSYTKSWDVNNFYRGLMSQP